MLYELHALACRQDDLISASSSPRTRRTTVKKDHLRVRISVALSACYNPAVVAEFPELQLVDQTLVRRS